MEPVKYMNIKEFKDEGYLQELNRHFLHPLGLALEVSADDDGNFILSGIWDYREIPEGIFFDYANSNPKRIEKALEKQSNIQSIRQKRNEKRNELLGFTLEPIVKENK